MFKLMLYQNNFFPNLEKNLVYEIVKYGDITFVKTCGIRLTHREALFNNKHLPAGVAQLVEHGTENPGVPSSILGPGTFYF